MSRKYKKTADQLEQHRDWIVEELKTGIMSSAQISKKTGLSVSYITGTIAVEEGINMMERMERVNAEKAERERRAKIDALVKVFKEDPAVMSMSTKAIAKQYGTGFYIVREALREMGVVKRHRSEKPRCRQNKYEFDESMAGTLSREGLCKAWV